MTGAEGRPKARITATVYRCEVCGHVTGDQDEMDFEERNGCSHPVYVHEEREVQV